jgi:hypothetical protein
MKSCWLLSAACVVLALGTGAPCARAALQDEKVSVTVAFGAGLNTATPNNPANHHVLPQIIDIKTGGVVNFAVAGFHQIYVYQPGMMAEDIFVPASGTFVEDLRSLYYKGILPAGGPSPGLPATVNPSNASNRMESVSFNEPGVYLVLCNVRTHFNDGMYAYVRVTGQSRTGQQ